MGSGDTRYNLCLVEFTFQEGDRQDTNQVKVQQIMTANEVERNGCIRKWYRTSNEGAV